MNFNGVQDEDTCIMMWREWELCAGMLCSEEQPCAVGWAAAGVGGREGDDAVHGALVISSPPV